MRLFERNTLKVTLRSNTGAYSFHIPITRATITRIVLSVCCYLMHVCACLQKIKYAYTGTFNMHTKTEALKMSNFSIDSTVRDSCCCCSFFDFSHRASLSCPHDFNAMRVYFYILKKCHTLFTISIDHMCTRPWKLRHKYSITKWNWDDYSILKIKFAPQMEIAITIIFETERDRKKREFFKSQCRFKILINDGVDWNSCRYIGTLMDAFTIR